MQSMKTSGETVGNTLEMAPFLLGHFSLFLNIAKKVPGELLILYIPYLPLVGSPRISHGISAFIWAFFPVHLLQR